MQPLLLVVATWLAAPAAAGTTSAAGPRWMVDRWTVEDGLPLNHANALAPGPDGRLWLATFEGLWRFDGTGFDRVPLGPSPGAPSPRVHDLARSPMTDDLWLTLEDGAVQRRGPDEVQTWRPGLPGPHELRLDAGGGLWLSGPEHCFALVTAADPAAPPEFPGSRDGGSPPPACPPGTDVPTDALFVGPLRVEPDGRVLDDHGLVVDLGLPVRDALWLDDQLWLATTGAGLVRVRPRLIEVVEAPAGRSPAVTRLQRDGASDSVWARSSDDHWWSVANPDVAVEPPALHAPTQGLRRIDAKSLPFTSPPWDPALRWWGTEGELRRELPGGRMEPVAGPRGFWQVNDTLLLPDDSLLVATTEGVWRIRPSGAGEVRSTDGASIATVRSMALRDPGTVVLGGGGQATVGEIDLHTDTAVIRTLDNPIRHVRVDGDWIWLATEQQGLCAVPRSGAASHPLLKPGSWRCLSVQDGLGTTGVHASMPDGLGHVWVSANRGIGVTAATSLEAFARGTVNEVGVTWFGTEAGLIDAEANGTAGGAVVIDGEGSLHFPTQHGVATVVPARYSDPPPPRLALTAVTVDGSSQPLDGTTVRLPADAGRVELHWTPVFLGAGAGLRVRYRIDGDADWSTAIADRTVPLPQLGPGDHSLELQAGNGELWGESTRLVVHRAFRLSERADLRVGTLLGASLCLLAAITLQRHRSRRQAQVLQERIDDATAALQAAHDQLARDNMDLDRQNAELVRQERQLQGLVREKAAHARELEELDRLKRNLIANISHELRTPLTLICGPVELLATTESDPVRRRDLALAARNAARLDALVKDLLLLSRAQSGAMPLRAQHLPLAALVGRVVGRFPPKQVRVAPLPEEPAEGLWCDPAMLDTALGNLLANALEHGGAGGEVTVTAGIEARDGVAGVRIAVRDQGPGVSPEARDTLFDRFQRGDGHRGGLGLGLALSRELIELHGGTLDHVAPEEGGASFRAWLPLGADHLGVDDIDADAPHARIEVPAPVGGPGRAPVLVVEDNPEILDFIAAHVGTRYDVVALADAEAALSWLKVHPALALVSDIMLPGMSGLDLARRVRAGAGTADLPVLLVSARGEVQDRVEGLGLADDYLPKPFSVQELLARLDALVRRARSPAAAGSGAALDEAPEAAAPVWLQELIDALDAHVDAHLSDPALDAASLARAVAMSQRTLSERLRERGLPSPAAWIRERRLTRAEEMLRAGDYQTVGEVAAAVGMSRAYFTRAFTARTGSPPRDRADRG